MRYLISIFYIVILSLGNNIYPDFTDKSVFFSLYNLLLFLLLLPIIIKKRKELRLKKAPLSKLMLPITVIPITELVFFIISPQLSFDTLRFLLGAICEEIFFRGILYFDARKKLSVINATLLTSLIFALFHLTNAYNGDVLQAIILLAYAFFTGACFCIISERTDSIIPAIAVHSSINIFSVTVLNSYISLTLSAVCFCYYLYNRKER